jgi:predicted anti-sigma-YlaC factor YlaD
MKFFGKNLSRWGKLAGMLVLLAGISSCALDKWVVGLAADALTGEGSATAFTSDDDPDMVGASLPTFIKVYESLLSMAPDHVGLMRTTGSLYIMYGNAFVDGPTLYYGVEQADAKLAATKRAGKLYLKGRNLQIKALEKLYPGFRKAVLQGKPAAHGATKEGDIAPYLAKMGKQDVGLLYWLAAGWFGAVAEDNMNIDLVLRLGNAVACLNRAAELDPDYQQGTLDELYIQVLSSVPADMGGSRDAAEAHFRRALQLSGGTSAGAYIAWGSSVLMNEQKREEFIALMKTALAIDLEKAPERKLVNVLNQERARYYLKNLDDFFLAPVD